MTTKEIEDELYRMLSDVVNGGYPKRTYTQQARYKEAVKRTVDALDILEEMSRSEKPNKWIPVSESTPPFGQDVLVCDLDGDMYITSLHLNGTWGFDYGGNKIKNVVAWQELPAPFKPQERDNESCDEIWERAYKEREGKKMNGSFELTLNNPLTQEDWDKIMDVELENTPSVTFKTPKGKQVKYIKADILDKIRAEIMKKENALDCTELLDTTSKIAYVEALKIIDKYKKESEAQE